MLALLPCWWVSVWAPTWKYRYKPPLSTAAKKHHTDGKVAAEVSAAAAAHETVRAKPKSLRPLRLDTRNGTETAKRYGTMSRSGALT